MAWRSRTSKKQRIRYDELTVFPGYAAHQRRPRPATTLPLTLHKRFLTTINSHNIDEPLTKRLSRKYWLLVERFEEEFKELKKLSDNRETDIYVETMISLFDKMTTFCLKNDKWALKSGHNITASTAINRFFEHVTKPTMADRPITKTREDQVAEFKKVDGRRMSDLIKESTK